MNVRFYDVCVATGGALFRVLGVRRTVLGLEHVPTEGPFVLAISHFSYLDFVFVGYPLVKEKSRYARFLGTKASFDHRITGPMMRAGGHIPVDRAAGSHAYDAAVEALTRGDVVALFPETRVSTSYTLLPFKTGAARMAAEAGVPVVPAVVWGSHRLLTRGHRSFRRGIPVTVVFGDALLIGGTESDAGTQELERVMTRLLTQAQDDYPERPAPGAWWVPAHRGGGAPAPDDRSHA
ncbi:MAG: 1-acyl-sn-glycerol-3-phosphate acyltransferase [Actinomycetota bacterium]|nr:1-acyl-sn-glycerol-3-phosphate acyltransferase [Actinomycetota bacterium]